MPRVKRRWERLENLVLLDNNLIHIDFELSRSRPSFFRVARESHLVVLRAMVQALRGTSNHAIVGKQRDKTRTGLYQKGDDPWKEIHRENVKGCLKAWRYSQPKPCAPPKLKLQTKGLPPIDDHLIGFYDLLAKIQTDCFMRPFFNALPASLTDDQMHLFEWLHENVRNEFEHYVPKLYSVDAVSLIGSSQLALSLSHWLIFRSQTVFPIDIPRGQAKRFLGVLRKLKRIQNQLAPKISEISVYEPNTLQARKPSGSNTSAAC
jgi:hypothetical protein